MPVTIHDILNPPPIDEASVERIAHRKKPYTISVVEPNPLWPQQYLEAKSRIESALQETTVLQEIHHVGSTSVPDLPAKDIIDIDLVVKDITNESLYVPQLESAGFRFLLREPKWHQHRFFVGEDGDFLVNLHVFGPECAEVERHKIFRDWLRGHREDREMYAKVKRECAEATVKGGESMQEYTERKEGVIEEIRLRAFRSLGYVK